MDEIRPAPPATDRPAVTPPATAQRDRSIAAICAVLLLIGMPIGYLPGSTGDKIGLAVMLVVSLALMAGIVFWFLPRQRAASADRLNRTALVLGILALLTCAVFWTGLPFAFGAGAIALGLSQRESAPPNARGTATAAAVLGAFAVVASFVVLLVG